MSSVPASSCSTSHAAGVRISAAAHATAPSKRA
jgi:hypothetical protein